VSRVSTREPARAVLARIHQAVVALGSGRGLEAAAASAEGLTKSKARYH
jgi:hypothetical protein